MVTTSESSDVSVGNLLDRMLEELRRRGADQSVLDAAAEVLSDKESRQRILDAARIDKNKIEKATEIKNQIQALTNELVALRYRVNEASKILGKRLFEDNTETARIGTRLGRRFVTDRDELHLFIDDLHKYIIQSANWDALYKSPHINPCLETIESYRNSFNHIYDMKGEGSGSERAYKGLGRITKKLLDHKIIKIEEFPLLQIMILDEVTKMLKKLEDNIEDWLGESDT